MSVNSDHWSRDGGRPHKHDDRQVSTIAPRIWKRES